jgi:uncharacterized protein (DUF1697 family)
MVKYIALLRAVNVGGTGKLPMSDLKAMCEDAGFSKVQTFIASGNVVFESKQVPVRSSVTLRRACLLTPKARLASWFAQRLKLQRY